MINDDVKDRIAASFDELEFLDMLDITIYDLIEAFKDRVEDNLEDILENIG